MRKFTLFFVSLFLAVGAMAQTPVVTVDNIGTAPYKLDDADAAKIFELENLTVVLDVTTAASLSGRGAFFCVADPAQAVPGSFSGSNTSFMACGHVNASIAYLAAAKDGQHFSTGAIPANSTIRIAYVFDKTNNKFKSYIGDTNTGWTMDRDFGTYEIATPKMVKEDFANANIYIGGGMANNANHELGDATIHKVRVYDGTLTVDEIKSLPGNYYAFKNGDKYITSIVSNSRIACSTTKDASAIYYFDGEHLLAYKTGLYIGLNASDWTFEAIGSNDISAIEFVAAANGAEEKYNICSGSRWLHLSENSDGSTFVNRCSANTCGNAHNWAIEAVEALPVTISAAKYATFYAPVEVTLPTDVEAYYVTIDGINGEKITLTKIDNGIVPANTGVILKAKEGTYELKITYTGVAPITGNLLCGTTAASYITDDAYVLTADAESEAGVCFGKAIKNQQSNAAWKNNSHKAYLPMSATNGAASYSFRFEDGTTAIENVEVENEVKAIYDLTGRRVEEITAPGIYIVNGKKTLVK